MVTTFYPPYNFGGDGIFVQRLTHALAERGHKVTVVHCADAYQFLGNSKSPPDVEHPPNVEVHTLHSGTGMVSPLVTHQLGVPGLKSAALRRILEGSDFDVIHFHNVSLIGGHGVLAYGKGIKLYTAHEYWLVCPLSTLWQFQSKPCTKKRCVSCTLNAGKPPQWWRYTGNLARNLAHVDALIAPSRFAIEKHREMGLDADFVHLPNFLPLAKPTPDANTAGHVQSRPFFLIAGRLEKSKGVQQAIEVFKQFDAADLLIVGTGQYEQELRDMARGADHIRFEGHVSYKALSSLYKQAVATIVPSIWYEPFGLIVIESFAQSTPVLVNNAGAPPELVRDSGGGLVFNNAEELRAALEQLLSDPAMRNDLGERGLAAYLAKWTEEQHLEQYFQLIQSRMHSNAQDSS
ncbi:MAG: glycosyltransferase involved in cell wall biosynthesis [Bacteroidia bacterium]|jgi:glycosyltransferase involved in cell wall biosynthesis